MFDPNKNLFIFLFLEYLTLKFINNIYFYKRKENLWINYHIQKNFIGLSLLYLTLFFPPAIFVIMTYDECLSPSLFASLIIGKTYLEFLYCKKIRNQFMHIVPIIKNRKEMFLLPYWNNDIFIFLSIMFLFFSYFLLNNKLIKSSDHKSWWIFSNIKKQSESIFNHMSTREKFN